MAILDIGNSNGKQSLLCAQLFPKSKILVLDISKEAIKKLNANGNNQITAEVADFNNQEDFENTIAQFSRYYEIIILHYTIYYMDNFERNLNLLLRFLAPEGKLICIGNSQFDIKELLNITQKYSNFKFKKSDFMENHLIKMSFNNYIHRTYYFKDLISFPDINSFIEYYYNYSPYSQEKEKNTIVEVERQIKEKGKFDLSKIYLVLIVDGAHFDAMKQELPKPLTNDDLSPDLYRKLLDKIVEKGFKVFQVKDIHNDVTSNCAKALILRHDVDLSPRHALWMAQDEAKRGIQATYFFLISGEYYNILESECRAALLAIKDLGHEIGLHFDKVEFLKQECKVLSSIIGIPIHSVSQHDPTIRELKRIKDMDLINAYDKKITENYGFVYVSDSGMKWRKYSAFDCLDFNKLYLLTHPESWYSNDIDLIQLHRVIQQHEINKLKRAYNQCVKDKIDYLRIRHKESNTS